MQLLGAGYARLSARQRRVLGATLTVSLALHLGGLVIFGGWIVMRQHTEEQTVFVTPPPVKTYQPRQLEHRVKVQKRQRSSSRPAMMPRLLTTKVAAITLPQVALDPKLITTSFQPQFKAVSGLGLGVGTGAGYGLSGFGQGVTDFNFFGIRGRGDRVALLVDVSVSMVEEERGGPGGFLRVRQRIHEVIEKLDEAALFNLVVFADAAEVWKAEMTIANPDHKQAAMSWFRRYNADGDYGLTSGNVEAAEMGLPAMGGTTRLDLALTAAFQQGADTILILSDGEPRVEKGTDPTRQRAYEQDLAKWEQKHADELAKAEWVEQKVWVDAQDGKLREGGPRGPASKGRWEVRRVRIGVPRGQPVAPEIAYWTVEDFLEHLRRLNEAVYAKKGRKSPVIHCIGYQIDSKGGDFLRKLAHAYKGKYRRVASLR
jgi:hypothetical protein